MKKITGVLTPHIVPLDERGEINEPELRRYVDWLIEHGVHGLYPNGSTGEFTRFTAAERRRIVEIVADQTAGRVPIVAGAAEANVRETIRACEHYAGLGVRAVAIVAPFYFKLPAEGVYAYYQEIARQSPVDVTLYNIPLFASPIDVPTVQRLAAECDRIVGIKDSSGDLGLVMRMIAAVRPVRPEFCFLTGWDSVLLPMLLMGCDGGTCASSGVVPELTRLLYDRTVAGQLAEAQELQQRLTTVFDALIDGVQFPEAVRRGVRLRGFRTGAGRQPLTDRQQTELDDRQRQLAELLKREIHERHSIMREAKSALGKICLIAFVVDDLDAAIAFYTGVGGLEVERRIPSGTPGQDFVFLKSGDLLVELMSRKIGMFRNLSPGFHHLSFATGDIDAAWAELQERDAPVLRPPNPEPSPHGFRMADFQGPEGVLLKLFWEKPSHGR